MSSPVLRLSRTTASLCLALLVLAPLGLTLTAARASAEGIVIEERPLSQPAPVITPSTTPAATPASTPATTSATHTSMEPVVTFPATVVPSPEATPAAPASTEPESRSESGNFWQLYSQLQQLQQEVALLRGTVEEQTHLIEKLQGDLRTRYTDLDQRLQQQQEQEQEQQKPPVATPTETPTPAASTLEDEKKAYLAAYDTFRIGGPDKAIAPMLAFVKKYPDSSLTPGAHYWLGEFYLNARKPDQVNARKQFDTVLAKYPDNAKAPAALYKIASILDLQGKPDETRQKMQELVKRYPKSPEASLAETWLKTLQAAQKQTPAAKPTPAKPTAKKQ